MTEPHLLVAGASGVIGTEAVEHFARAGWRVTALSRRAPVTSPDAAYRHLALDLDDRAACEAAVAALPPVTHLVYAAVAEAPGLVGGWYDEALIERNGAMFANILDPLAAAGALAHVSILQGTKAYGAHHHAVEVPAREDRPRDDHPNFYWRHEDHLRARAAEAGFAFTIWRPQVLLGAAPGAAMNPVAAIGAFAALCRELGRPFAYPGGATTVWELVDTGLLAEAFEWAAGSPAAAGETFNIANGDVMVPAHAWPHLAAALGLPAVDPQPARLVDFFAAAETQAAWARLVARHGLREPDLAALLGQSHHYVDLLAGSRIAEKAVPVLLSTIKLRQAGFAPCRDSLASLLHWIGRMVDLRLLPPFGEPA
ncbi:NAD-dependent epimerase/dehydratase family protein [Sphingomonas solaris]|uniref:NAD-dependent epimerase/dehydratase family protein n=1 Tax=Alterirhizorhabdus solaris TaxID=2529389 RepID=A0A558RB93_9SPHN|nr:NAD-dependent epimerase/dehydratase family protein [Sphingomonas solaris]TVV76717.1 NAD-dependent epimerase/dehydratase family protein [Sphingomonas solaris]